MISSTKILVDAMAAEDPKAVSDDLNSLTAAGIYIYAFN